MVYERISITPRYATIRIKYEKEPALIKITSYDPIPPIYLTNRAICAEFIPIPKPRARMQRVPRIIMSAYSDEALENAKQFFRSLIH